ncbi:MAG: hypothetical protein U5K37_00450 [Natrialbaceae archaeon]|nr:hypothetical protein [Natrialbaceae archaeon]
MTDSGPLAIVLVVLVAVTMLPTTLGLPASQPAPGQVGDPVPAAETTNRLALSGNQRGGHHIVRPDLGSTLLGTDDVLRADHEQYVLMEHDFSSVPVGQREDLVRQTYQRILDRIDILEANEANAVRSHANGTISDTQLVQSRHRISTEAAYLESAIDEVAHRSSRSPGIAISASQFRDDKSRLEMLQSPVSNRIDASLRGSPSTGQPLLPFERPRLAIS